MTIMTTTLRKVIEGIAVADAIGNPLKFMGLVSNEAFKNQQGLLGTGVRRHSNDLVCCSALSHPGKL